MSFTLVQATINNTDLPVFMSLFEKYNVDAVVLGKDDNFDYFPPDVVEALSIAEEQSKLGMTLSNEEVFKEIEKKRAEKWK